MDFIQHESLATHEKWLLALLLSVVIMYVYSEMRTWHVSVEITTWEFSALTCIQIILQQWLRKVSRLTSILSSTIKDYVCTPILAPGLCGIFEG